MKPHNPYTDPHIGLSECCNAPTHTVPAGLGDPSFSFCSNCNTECKIIWKPMYEMIGKGHYRPIKYEINKK